MSEEEVKEEDLLEILASLEHEQWAHWTRYMLGNLSEKNINRWKEQIETSYSNLSEKEKESDREWARKVLEVPLIREALEKAEKWDFWENKMKEGISLISSKKLEEIQKIESERDYWKGVAEQYNSIEETSQRSSGKSRNC